MRTLLRGLTVALLVGAAPFGWPDAHAENASAVADVLKLHTSGVAEDTLVAFVQSRNVNYALSADDVLRLRDKGLPAPVINAMLAEPKLAQPASAPVPAPPAPTPPPAAAPPAAPVSSTTLPSAGAPVVVAPAAPAAVIAPPGLSPDVSYFHQELSPYGHWILVEDGQWYWQPSVVLTNPGWRPYWDRGRWVWSDHGWYWISDYSWGWAVFHYGRWQLHPRHGWVWRPDRVWGPGWVVWRGGGDYCGWAPLPPGAVYETAGGWFVFRGRRVEAGFDFGLGPAHFSFCLRRELGGRLPSRPRPPHESLGIFGRTTVRHVYSAERVVVGGEPRIRVFNHGMEPLGPGVRSGRDRGPGPVRVREFDTPPPGRSRERMRSSSGTIEVYRPRFPEHR